MSSEARLWQRLRDGVRPHCFVQRIENSVSAGVPDVWLCSRENGQGAWVELKYRPSLPVRENTAIFKGGYGIRPEQVAWIYGRATAGARIYILGQCGDSLWLLHGRFAREISTFPVAVLDECCAWKGTARRTEWREMIGFLKLI